MFQQAIQRAAQQNPHLAAALDGIPGYHEATAVAEQAEQRLTTLGAHPAPDLPSPLHTGVVTDDWVEARVDHALAATEHAAHEAVLVELRNTARATIDGVTVQHADRILATLHTALADVIARGRTLGADLHGARTPGDAIAAGPHVSAAYLAITELVPEYEQIRAAQTLVMSDHVDDAQSAKSTANPDPLASDLLLANLDQLVPGWHNPRPDLSGRPVWSPPWPTDPVEQFVWLCTSDARPWVPTRKQLHTLWQSRKPAVVKPIEPVTTIRQQSLDRHPERGLDPFSRIARAIR